MDKDKLLEQLEDVGLSEKEAKTYLASLELGPSTAQHIAAKAQITRPTTYMMIESLISRGLIRKTKQGKKYIFCPQPISQLKSVLEERERKIKSQKTAVDKISQYLNLLGGKDDSSGAIYHGQEALEAVRRDVVKEKALIREIVPIDVARRFFPPPSDDPADARNDYAGSVSRETIALYDGGVYEEHDKIKKDKNSKVRRLDRDKYPVSMEILILSDAVILLSYEGGVSSVHLYGKSAIDTMNVFFGLLWETAEPVIKT